MISIIPLKKKKKLIVNMNGILNPIKNKYDMDMDIIRILESFE